MIYIKVLVVEDNKNIEKTLLKELSSRGYEVYSIKKLNNVIDEFKEIEPQLVLLDIVLPYFNEDYWCQEIRKFSNVPIVFISSKSDNMDTVMAM